MKNVTILAIYLVIIRVLLLKFTMLVGDLVSLHLLYACMLT